MRILNLVQTPKVPAKAQGKATMSPIGKKARGRPKGSKNRQLTASEIKEKCEPRPVASRSGPRPEPQRAPPGWQAGRDPRRDDGRGHREH
jgi:hypothetical protein